MTWLTLDAIDDATSGRCAALSKPYTGDASTVSVVIERGSPPAPEEGEEAPAEVEDDGEPAPEGYVKCSITEAMRLSYSVAAIDSSCACIPKGAMIMDANENVAPNRAFGGAYCLPSQPIGLVPVAPQPPPAPEIPRSGGCLSLSLVPSLG